MKLAFLCGLLFVATILTGCAKPTVNTASLSDHSAPTSRLPSPGNYQRGVMQQSSTMMLPERP